MMKLSIAISRRILLPGGLASKMALMRIFALIVSSLIAASSMTANAFSQTPPAKNGWSLLRGLPQRTRIHVAGAGMDKPCNFLFADDEKLVCSSGRIPFTAIIVFSRSEVQAVRLSFWAESELTGYSIRFGSSTHFRAVTKSRSDDDVEPLSDAILGLAVLADRLINGGIGTSIDVVRGCTVYQKTEPHA
jgi:hypothetical protein